MQKTMDNQKTGTTPKKRKKMALGRGLDALIPMEAPEEGDAREYLLCDVELIRPNRYQPRRRFSEDELEQLRDSIREQGVIQPLIVRKDGTGYELVAGERRLRASKMAGLPQVPVLIKEITDVKLLELSIIENIQREDLNPLDEAEAYHRLIDEFNLTQEEAARRVGKSRSAVTNSLRLRQLPEPIKGSILDNSLSMGHARALLGAEATAQQIAAWRTVIAKGLSVRQTEALVKKLKTEKISPPQSPKNTEDIHLENLAQELSRRFGTRVQIKRRGKKGRVEIDFFNNDDLNRLLEMLNRV